MWLSTAFVGKPDDLSSGRSRLALTVTIVSCNRCFHSGVQVVEVRFRPARFAAADTRRPVQAAIELPARGVGSAQVPPRGALLNEPDGRAGTGPSLAGLRWLRITRKADGRRNHQVR